MPEGYEVVIVGEGDDSLAFDLGDWEHVLEYVDYPLAQLGGEVVEYEMGVGFGHGGQSFFDVVPEDHVLESEVYGGAYRHVAHNHPIGLPPVLMQQYQVSQILLLAEAYQVVNDITASIYSVCIGHDNRHLLQELDQPA